MKIYIVTSGEYSDYRIDAVFLDKEKAEKYCEIHDAIIENPGYFVIEEYQTEDDKVQMEDRVVQYYRCKINLLNGEINKYYEEYNKEFDIYTKDKYFKISKFQKNFLTAYSINSYEQAKKIAIEQYQLYTQRKLEDEL